MLRINSLKEGTEWHLHTIRTTLLKRCYYENSLSASHLQSLQLLRDPYGKLALLKRVSDTHTP